MANVVTAIGQWLNSAKGKIIAPKTLTKYVFDENGKSVEERFTLINTDAGNTIDVTLNKETYEMTVILKNKNGEELSSKTVDFPMELAFVNASYVEGQKKITFTLQSGAEVEVPLAKLIDGLVNTEDFNAAIDEIKTQIGKYTNYIDTDELNFSENGINVYNSTSGKIFVLGTATADTEIQVGHKIIKRIYANADHKLKLVGCPPGGSADTYYLYAKRPFGGDKFYDYGSGCEIPVTRNDHYYLYFCIKNGTTVGNIEEDEELEIRPMITNNMNCTYDDYCPYIGGSSVINTLRSMYIKINNILKRADNTDTSIKSLNNAIEYSYKSIGRYNNLLVSNGKSFVKLYDDNDDSTKITITYNGDGTYTLNGTTGNSNDTGKYISVDLTDSFVLKEGTYYLTGLPSDGVINPNDRIYLGGWQKDIKMGINITGEWKLNLQIGSNVTFDNAILKPMLVVYDENNIPTYDDFVVGIAPNTSLYMNVNELKKDIVNTKNDSYDLKMLGWTVPNECPIKNTVSNNTFIQNVGRIDLGTVEWVYRDSAPYFYFVIPTTYIKYIGNFANVKHNVYCFKYLTVKRNDTEFINKTMVVDGNINTHTISQIQIKDSSYTDAVAFKQAMQGVYLYYELATPITMTIDGNEKTEQIDDSLSLTRYGEFSGSGNLFDESSEKFFKYSSSAYMVYRIPFTGYYMLSMSFKEGKTISDLAGISFGGVVTPNKPGTEFKWYISNGTVSMLSFYSNYPYLFIYPGTNESVDKVLSTLNIMIEKSNTASEYEKYFMSNINQYNALTNLQKNLLIKQKISSNIKGAILGSDGSYNSSYDEYRCTDYIKVLPLTLIKVELAASSDDFAVIFYDENKAYVDAEKRLSGGITKNTVIGYTSINTQYIRICYRAASNPTDYVYLYTTNSGTNIEPMKNIIGSYKNLLNINNYSGNGTLVINGITCISNNDGTYTVTGTATDNVYILIENITEIAKRYVNKPLYLTGCPSDGGPDKYDLRYEINNTAGNGGCNLYDASYGIAHNNMLPADKITGATIYIAIKKGITAKNLVFKPMLTEYPTDGYNSFLPPIGSNSNIQNDIFDIKQRQFYKWMQGNSSIIISLQGIYLISYWQGAAWTVVGCGILSSSNYKESSKYTPLISESSITITPNGNSTVTIKNNIAAAITIYFTKLSV